MSERVHVPDGKSLQLGKLGPRPRMDWIPVDMLRVDPAYQRSIRGERSIRLIRKIAAEFDWQKFQPISVAERPNGTFAVIDGQHRVSAATLRGDIFELPCYVVPVETVSDEASAFMSLNRDRVQVHQAAMLKARAEAGDETALRVIGVMAQARVTLVEGQRGKSNTDTCTQAAGRIEKLIAKHGTPHVIDALRSLALAYPGEELRAPLIAAVASISHHSKRPLDLDRMATALREYSQADWLMYGTIDRLSFGSVPAATAFLIAKQYQDRAA